MGKVETYNGRDIFNLTTGAIISTFKTLTQLQRTLKASEQTQSRQTNLTESSAARDAPSDAILCPQQDVK